MPSSSVPGLTGAACLRRPWSVLLVALILAVGACTSDDPASDAGEHVESAQQAPSPAPTEAEPEPADEEEQDSADSPILTVLMRRDGDSFVASDGVEYRVGLINTPEGNECGGSEASERTYALLSDGFTVEAYSQDNNGRIVARIGTPEGDLGVLLAAEGFADDRYLEQFAFENPDYAREVEAAFAQAREEQVGFYATCWAEGDPGTGAGEQAATADQPLFDGTHQGRTGVWSCHPAYVECIPDGDDLDCREVGHNVTLVGSADPFRLDGNSTTATDGLGCDTFPPWTAETTYPYY